MARMAVDDAVLFGTFPTIETVIGVKRQAYSSQSEIVLPPPLTRETKIKKINK